MFSESRAGLKRFNNWEKLPAIAGAYDCISEHLEDDISHGYVNAYPKIESSVSDAIGNALISIDDVNEIIYQVFGPAHQEIIEYRQLFKNKIDQVFLALMLPKPIVERDYEAANFTLTKELYESIRPRISFFKTIDEAIYLHLKE